MKKYYFMAHKGQIISDEFTIMEFLETSEDTDGKYSKILVTFKPGSFKAVDHIHLFQDETFRVRSGILTYKLDGITNKISSGEEITLPKGKPHTHFNDEKYDLITEQIISPALDVEYLLETIFGFAGEGKIKKGKIPFFQVMLWLKYLKAKTYLASLPISVQDFLSSVTAPIARKKGYQIAYKRFSGTDVL
ncbi:MAG: cupin domain-containing protein [Bacteroidetes bacterium]|nr:cupin domain-containing protein [Bacteroidota bacterium]